MKTIILFLITLILPLASIAQDNVFQPFNYDSRFDAFARFRIEAENSSELKKIGVRGRVGGYYDTADKIGGYAAIGVRLAKGSFFDFYLYPFWLNYSFKDKNYNTPVTIEMVFWDYRHKKDNLGFRLALDIDFYRDTFVPSLNVAFQPWKRVYN